MRTSTESRTVSVMFIDMVASTTMLTDMGDEAFKRVRHRYDDDVRRAIAAGDGEHIKSTGDGTLAVFGGAAQAVAAAAQVQQTAMTVRATGQTFPLLRIGISLGDCQFEDGDVFGSAVVVAARLCDACPADGVLITDVLASIAAAKAEIATGARFEIELKGIAAPVAVRSLSWQTAATFGLPLPPRMVDTEALAFFGRTAELAAIREQYVRSLDGDLAAVVLSGEPGIGKTRLASAAVQSLHADGATVLFGRCDEREVAALQPVTEWLEFLISNTKASTLVDDLGPGIRQLSRLAPQLIAHLANDDPSAASDSQLAAELSGTVSSGDRYQFYRAVAQWLTNLSAARPVVLVVDDLQWATPSTIELLSTLVATPKIGRITLVCTIRDTETDRNDSVADLLTQLHRRGNLRELRLVGFDPAAIEAMISSFAGRSLTSEETLASHAIAAATSGNPLFVTELLRHLTETNAIALEGTHLRLVVDADQLQVPPSIRAIVDQRVRRLGQDAERVLEAAAVLGARFEAGVVGAMLELDEDSLDLILGRIVDARVVVDRMGPRSQLEFSHALVRHTIYTSINDRRRQQMHRLAARCLADERSGKLDESTLAIAHHHQLGGSREIGNTIEAFERAAEYSTSRLDHAAATDWYQAALELRGERGDEDDQLVRLLTGYGQSLKRAGRADFSAPLLRAAALAQRLGDHAGRLAALLAIHRGIYASAGKVDHEVVAALQGLLQDTHDDDLRTRALVGAQLASELTWHADGDLKRSTATTAEALARELGDSAVLARVLQCVFDVFQGIESGQQLVTRSSELLALGQQLNDPFFTFFGAVDLASSAMAAGRIDLARETIDIGYAAFARIGEPIAEVQLNPRHASLLIATGRFEEGLKIAERGYQIRVDSKQPEAIMVYGAHQFEWLRHIGKLADVEPLIAASVEEDSSLRVFAAALALIYCASDRREMAKELWEKTTGGDALRMLEGTQSVLSTLSIVAELVYELGDRAGAAAILPFVMGRRADFAVSGPSFRGPMTASLAMLHATLGDDDAAVQLFDESIATCDRIGLTPEATHLRVHAARYQLSLGELAVARNYAQAAIPSAVALGMEGAQSAANAILASIKSGPS